MIAADDYRYLRMILLQVPDDQRELLELRLAGLSASEIAEVLGRSPGAIRTAHSRAVANLRTLMNANITSEEAHV